jgi:hypothetical protein
MEIDRLEDRQIGKWIGRQIDDYAYNNVSDI